MNEVIENNAVKEYDIFSELKTNPYVITICSGKGGVGKSILASNLAYKIAEESLTVLLWDADMNFPNQHLLLGVEPPVRISEVYSGEMSLSSAIFPVYRNLFVLADAPAAGKSERYNSPVITNTFNELIKENDFDVIIFDAPAGGSFEVLQCCALSDLNAIVVTDEPTSLLDAYGLIKILLNYIDIEKLNLLVNNVIDWEDADDISTKLNLATEKFLQTKIDVLGFIPYHRIVRQSILRQELFVISDSDSEVAKAVKNISNKLIDKIVSIEK